MENRVKQAIKMIGGARIAAEICGVKPRAIYKWISRGRLPHQAYTGEKPYAELLASHPSARFTADWLIDREKNAA